MYKLCYTPTPTSINFHIIDEEGVYSCTAWCDVSGVRSGVISGEYLIR